MKKSLLIQDNAISDYVELVEVETQDFRLSQYVGDSNPAIIDPLIKLVVDRISQTVAVPNRWISAVELAVQESLANAIFHGNLEIESQLYRQDPDAFYQLAEERRQQHPYRKRGVELSMLIEDELVEFNIRDEGPGFDMAHVPNPVDEANLAKPCGRGLLLMQSSMDQVTFRGRGNVVTMRKRVQPFQQVA